MKNLFFYWKVLNFGVLAACGRRPAEKVFTGRGMIDFSIVDEINQLLILTERRWLNGWNVTIDILFLKSIVVFVEFKSAFRFFNAFGFRLNLNVFFLSLNKRFIISIPFEHTGSEANEIKGCHQQVG